MFCFEVIYTYYSGGRRVFEKEAKETNYFQQFRRWGSRNNISFKINARIGEIVFHANLPFLISRFWTSKPRLF